MATRQHVRKQSEALKNDLRAACREKRLRAGDAVPPLRELCSQFGLSRGVVVTALRELCEEGLLHTVERVGTFVGPPRPAQRPLFVLLAEPLMHPADDVMRRGFEERIAVLGGSVIAIGLSMAKQLLAQGRFPVCAGLFEVSLELDDADGETAEGKAEAAPQAICFRGARALPFVGALQNSARVHFGDGFVGHPHDCVSFDDHAGGELAAEYLLALGHRRVAFIGLHGADDVLKLHSGQAVRPEWSVRREEGWRSAMARAHAPTDGLSFYARSRVDQEHDLIALADESTWAFIKAFKASVSTSGRITATVVANDQTARLLSARLLASNIERELWPAVVSFDGDEQLQNDVLTSLRLPWDKLGREAAILLWERSQGVLTGAPVHRRVAPILIPRLSCHADPNTRTLAA